jgi:hypothetical protein
LQARSYRKRFSHNWFLSIWFGAFRPHVSLSHLACLLVFSLASLVSAQTTIHVPADQPTIQAGINAANNGDTVLVVPGTYYESIDFKGKSITVISASGAAQTIIDGSKGNGASAVSFITGEPRTTVLSGFTIQNGGLEGIDGPIPGILYRGGAQASLVNDIITHNHCYGVWADGGSPLIQNSNINNTLDNNGDCSIAGGAGIFLGNSVVDSNGNPVPAVVIGNTIEDNTQSGNEDAGGNGGAGIAVWTGSPIIMNNTIRNNATSFGNGGAINLEEGQGAVIVQNLIYGNSAGCGGGAIAGETPTDPRTGIAALIANNTIVNNTGSTQANSETCTSVSQIFPLLASLLSNGPATMIINNVISGASSYPAVNCDSFSTPSEANQPTFQNDILYNAGGPFFGSYCIDVSNEYNNITSDPQFVSSSGNNYQLKSTSPAINAGQNSVLQTFQAMTGQSWTRDFAGNPRVQSSNANSCTIDMGAYEYPGTADLCSTSTTLTLNSAPNPSLLNQSVTFTINSSASDGTHPGPITLSDTTTNTTLSTLTPDAQGNANYAISTLTPGNHNITASYLGTSTYGSANASLTQVVDYLPTAMYITSSPNPSNLGQAVTLYATVETQYGTPTGAVTFSDGSKTLATVNLVNASATYTTSSLTAGQHIISAAYPPNTTWNGSVQSITQVVNGQPTATALTASPNPAYALQSVTLAAKVTTTATGTPTGTVTFSDGGTALGTANLAANGRATLPVTFAAVSATPHQLTATYSGDSSFNSSTSAAWPETIEFNPTTTLITTMVPNPVDSFASATLSATVNSSTSPGNAPTGSISFTAGGKPLGTGTLVNGTVSVPIIAPAPGSYHVIANYSGDTAFFPSASPSQTLVVIPDVVSVTLISSENPSVFDDSVTFTASISTTNPAPLTGTFTFFDGKTQIGRSVKIDSTGTATYTTTTLAVGTHPITAVYSGNADIAGATSSILNQVVQPYTGDFTLNITPANATIYTGGRAGFIITATPENGFNLPLGLTCSSLPADTACVFGPARIVANPPPGSEFYVPYASTLTIKTVAPSPKTSAASLKARWTGGAAALACLCGILIVPRRALRVRLVLIGAVLIGIFSAISGCGGGGTLTGGTPPGTYQINITAQTPGGGPQLSQVVSIKLVVKSLF